MKRKFFTNISIIVLSSFALTSCLNDDGDTGDVRPGFISFVNAMSDTSALDFYVSAYGAPVDLENDLLGQGSLSYTESFPSFTATNGSYVNAHPYTYVLRVTYPQNDTVLTGGTIDVRQDNYYSVFIYSTADSLKGVRQQDDLTTPGAGMAKVRFMNFGKGTSEVDLIADGETLFSGYDFQEAPEEFEEIPAGNYMVEVQDSGTSNVLTSGAIDLEDSKIYTVWLGGTLDSTGLKALRVETVEHAPAAAETPAQ